MTQATGTEPIAEGERVLLIDGKGRHYLVKLQRGGTFHFHGGAVSHDDILGRAEGIQVRSASEASLFVFRPRMADFLLKMPRGAQVVYPKDISAICMFADIFPGARVLEAGTGSGALSIAICRAVGADGVVVTYEMRPEFREKAAVNIASFFGELPAGLQMRDGDMRDVAGAGESFDRVVLDMPEPWAMLDVVEEVLTPGGIVCAFLPTTVQIQTLVVELERSGFAQVDTIELMLRPWHVTSRSVRPGHRMVAHTGFITTARKGS
jgi:tRNA (adenine57-N1/adenine58-N1)-methyltransferase